MPSILLIIAILAILVILIYILINKVDPKKNDKLSTTGSSNNFYPGLGWRSPGPSPGEVCHGYKFNTIDSPEFKPGIAILNEKYINDPTVTKGDPFECVDIDTLNAIKLIRTCDIKAPGYDEKLEQGCKGIDGKIYKYGETETYYGNCDNLGNFGAKAQVLNCPGQIAYISAGFHSKESEPLNFPCLYLDKNDVNGNTLKFKEPCDPSMNESQFRLILSTSEVYPTEYISGTGNIDKGISGSIAAIIERESGDCIVPSGDGSLLTAEKPSKNNKQGFVWLMLRPIQTTIGNSLSPQQIIYIGDIKFPYQLTQLDDDNIGQSIRANALHALVNDNGIAKMAFAATEGYPCCACTSKTNGCDLVCAGNNACTPEFLGHNAQFVTLPIYKELVNYNFRSFNTLTKPFNK